jgi:1,4-dihydroxy-2-naphthoate octaprenyltransferase
MGGPKPIAYTPFGEVLVLLFFGLTAVCGTYYLQTSELTINCILLGAALGTIASGVLAVNNFRDREHDESIGRRTLAVLIGEKSFLRLFDALLLIPYALVALMVVTDISRWPYFLVILSLPLAMRVSQQIRRSQHEALNEVMFSCVQLEARFALLFAIGASTQAVLMSLTLSNMLN